MYTYVVEAHNGGTLLQRPVKGKYHYLFGDHFLVAPIYKDELVNEVNLPKGKWRYFFDDSEIVEGPARFQKEFPLDEYPVYIREGAIVPMEIKRDYTGIGDESFNGFLTYLIYPEGESSFTVHHPDLSGSTTVKVSDSAEKLTIKISRVKKPHILKINLDKMPLKIELDGRQLSDSADFSFSGTSKKLIIRTSEYKTGNYTILK
jgi:alpha-glucosidase (family GH31 glycosyl hydrolase)